jgi:BirA family transcriptional regulator, biotin operon repressor / biotin---[acetyl-CoA-carboxylase] ligase
MDLHALEQALADLPLGPLRYFGQTGSTNADAALWAEAGAPDLALVIADEQTAGRGRLGRRWLTPPGAALAFSLVLRPGSGDWTPAHLTALGALAVCNALLEGYQLAAQIKWPNDVLLERRKLGGILVEAYWQGETLETAILGIGVNVTQAAVPDEAEVVFPATCVEAWSRSPVDRLELLHSVLRRLLEWRPRLGSDEFLHAWEERLAFRNEWVRVSPGNGEALPPEIHEGQIQGLEADGGLRLRNHAGQVFTLHAGELSLLA